MAAYVKRFIEALATGAAALLIVLPSFAQEKSDFYETLKRRDRAVTEIYIEIHKRLFFYTAKFPELIHRVEAIELAGKGMMTEEEQKYFVAVADYFAQNYAADKCGPFITNMKRKGRQILAESQKLGGGEKAEERIWTLYDAVEENGRKGLDCVSGEEKYLEETIRKLREIQESLALKKPI